MAFANTSECGVVTGEAGAPPVVDAGNNQQVLAVAGSAMLAGTATSPAGIIMGIAWSKISGPDSYTIADAGSTTTQVDNLIAGVYQFALTASDNFYNQASDTVTITVLHSNTAPVANAGTDQTITLPMNYITLTATATDVDKDLQAVSWMQVSGPMAAVIVNPNLYRCTMDKLVEGVYKFAFTGTDSYGATGTDTVAVTVLKATGNIAGRCV